MLVFIIGIVLTAGYLLMKFYELIMNKPLTRSWWVLLICIGGVALLASQIKPPQSWDLYRHYQEIDKMRMLGAQYAWTKSRYAD